MYKYILQFFSSRKTSISKVEFPTNSNVEDKATDEIVAVVNHKEEIQESFLTEKIQNNSFKNLTNEKKLQEHFLENTTNTHLLKAPKIKIIKEIGSTQVITIKGEGIISHGEHGILKIESNHIIKYVQQEFNPITRIIENAYD